MKRNLLFFVVLLTTTSAFSQWSLTGNSGTTSSNFMGTTDDNPVIFRVKNEPSGFTGYSGNYNVSFGWKALVNFTTGSGNTAVGAQALQYSRGIDNTAVGHWAMLYNKGNYNVGVGSSVLNTGGTASYNVAIGHAVLSKNTKDGNVGVGYESAVNNSTGEGITAVGFKALRHNTSGSRNSAFGQHALINNTTGVWNTAIGAETLINNTTGPYNTAIGGKALYHNTTGEYNTAIGLHSLKNNNIGGWNVAFGAGSLQHNTTGYLNTGLGTSAMHFNTIGKDNVAVGTEALSGNVSGNYNTAVGSRALWSVENPSPENGLQEARILPGAGGASNNTAVGYEALRDLISGQANTAVGVHALRVNSTGNSNIAIGNYALTNNTKGHYNIALGNNTLNKNITGSFNMVLGYDANVTGNNLINTVVIGYGARGTANNQIAIGNSSITSIRGFTNWTTISDSRVIKNINQNVPGLSFINELVPVCYSMDLDAIDKKLQKTGVTYSEKEIAARKSKEQIVYTGFVAQDVDKTAKSLGYNFSGVDADGTDDGLYGLRYAEFVTPTVKAIQELSAKNDELQSQIDKLKEAIDLLSSGGTLSGDEAISDPNASSTSLQQNYPNPFSQISIIRYRLPDSLSSAKIVIMDNNGRLMRQIFLDSVPGESSIDFDAALLRTGIYFYSLYVDNKLIDTKKMILTK